MFIITSKKWISFNRPAKYLTTLSCEVSQIHHGTIFDDVATTSTMNIVLKDDVTIPRFTVNQPLASIPQFLLYPPKYSSNLELSTESSNN